MSVVDLGIGEFYLSKGKLPLNIKFENPNKKFVHAGYQIGAVLVERSRNWLLSE